MQKPRMPRSKAAPWTSASSSVGARPRRITHPGHARHQRRVLRVFSILNGDLDHLNGRLRAIARAGRRGFDLLYDVHSGRDLAEHGVLRCAGAEPVEIRVVLGVDEKLAASAVRLTR